MIFSKYVYWHLLFILCIRALEAAKIYVIDLPNAESDTALINNYDDYDPINEFTYDDRNKRNRTFNTAAPEKFTNDDKTSANEALCQRLFGSIFGHRNQHVRCLEALRSNKRSNDYGLRPKEKLKFRPIFNQFVSQYGGLKKNSRNYLDIRDLGRTEGFASDYVDVDDFKIARITPECDRITKIDEFGEFTNINCIPDSRKAGLAIEENNKFRGTKDHSDSSDESKSDEVQKYARKKPKRYKVVSKEEDFKDSDETDERQEKDNELEIHNISSEPDVIQTSGSNEITTTKPKPKRKKTRGFDDKYLYLQGNKYFDKDDLRRSLRTRMTYFLPKRVHWDESDYGRLSYFWFNGPKGKYRVS